MHQFQEGIEKAASQIDVLHCHLCPSQLPKRGDVIGRIMKRRFEQIDEKDANVRQVELKPIIMDVVTELVSILTKALDPCWGVGYTEKRAEKTSLETKVKIAKSRKISDELAINMSRGDRG